MTGICRRSRRSTRLLPREAFGKFRPCWEGPSWLFQRWKWGNPSGCIIVGWQGKVTQNRTVNSFGWPRINLFWLKLTKEFTLFWSWRATNIQNASRFKFRVCLAWPCLCVITNVLDLKLSVQQVYHCQVWLDSVLIKSKQKQPNHDGEKN